MKKLVFDERYHTYHDEVDKEHKELFEMYNKIIDGVKEEYDVKIMEEMIREMSNQIFQHFHHEEEVMKEISYPNLENHKKEHHKFLTQVTKTSLKYLTPHSTVPGEVLVALSSSWLKHIVLFDMEFIEYSKKQALSIELPKQ